MLLDSLKAMEVIATTKVNPFYAHLRFRTDEGLIKGDEEIGSEALIEDGRGVWGVMYRPREDQPRFRGKPYIVFSPTQVKIRVRFADWADFDEYSKKKSQVKWIRKWSDISEEMFAVAKRNMGYTIPIRIDIVGYEAHLQELYRKENGEDAVGEGLLGFPHEGEASAAASDMYNNQLYADLKERKIANKRKSHPHV